MAKTSPDLIPGAGSGELAHGTLRLWDAIAISVSVIAPGMAMLLNVTGVAAVSGGSTPLAFLLGGIPAWRWRSSSSGSAGGWRPPATPTPTPAGASARKRAS
jgi:hypothetical protein